MVIVGKIIKIDGNKITVKAETEFTFEEFYHPEYFQFGTVEIICNDIAMSIVANTPQGKGYCVVKP